MRGFESTANGSIREAEDSIFYLVPIRVVTVATETKLMRLPLMERPIDLLIRRKLTKHTAALGMRSVCTGCAGEFDEARYQLSRRGAALGADIHRCPQKPLKRCLFFRR